MIVDIFRDPAVLTLIGQVFSGLCAVLIVWINRNKPPRLPPALIPIVLLLGGALSGLALGRPALARLFAPKGDVLEAASCGYDNCEKKNGCRCSGDQCRCASVDDKPRLIPEPSREPKPQKTPLKPKPSSSSMAAVLPVMAGKPWGWFVEPLWAEPLEPSL